MSNATLKVEIKKLLAEVNRQHDVVHQKADEMGISAYQLQNKDGSYMLVDLLAAKANLLSALAKLG